MPDTNSPIALRALDLPVTAIASHYPEPFASRVSGREKRKLGDAFGLRNFGVSLVRLAPGVPSALRHAHAKQDELYYVLEGRPTLYTDKGATPLEPGMTAGFRAGTGEGHHLVNETDEVALVLIVGDRTPGERATYPDDDLEARAVEDGYVFTHKDGSPY